MCALFSSPFAGLQLVYFVLSDVLLLAVATSSVLGASATSQDSSYLARTSRQPLPQGKKHASAGLMTFLILC